MAITLLEIARQKKDSFERETVWNVAQESDPLKLLPVETIGRLEVSARRTNSIATVGFRKRGEAFGAVSGGGSDVVTDAIYHMGATIDIDISDLRDKSLTVNPLAERAKDASKAMAWKFNETFIQGDQAVDEDTFEGLKVRLATKPSSQKIYANDSTTAVDLSAAIAANTTATMQTFFDKVDEALYALDGHSADMILTTDQMIAKWNAARRRLNLYKDVDPELPAAIGSNVRRTSGQVVNSPVMKYRGIPVYDLGLDHGQTDRIIATETFTADAATPIYFVKVGYPYLRVIQQYAMEVGKPFMLQDGVTWRQVIQWPVGMQDVHTKGLSKLAGYEVQ